ncbi:hypothetical protein SUGI_0995610 [Cryptomeria japonica]|nr:hypothetical protein SUGI_0995610 [Cryptomeria japonica]
MGFTHYVIWPLELLEDKEIVVSKDEFWCYIEELHSAQVQSQNEENEELCRTMEWVNISQPYRLGVIPKKMLRAFRDVFIYFHDMRHPYIQAQTNFDIFVVLCSNPATATATATTPRPRPLDAIFVERKEGTDVSMAQRGQEYYQEQYLVSLGRNPFTYPWPTKPTDMHNNNNTTHPVDLFFRRRPNYSLYPHGGFYIMPFYPYGGFYIMPFYPNGGFYIRPF